MKNIIYEVKQLTERRIWPRICWLDWKKIYFGTEDPVDDQIWWRIGNLVLNQLKQFKGKNND